MIQKTVQKRPATTSAARAPAAPSKAASSSRQMNDYVLVRRRMHDKKYAAGLLLERRMENQHPPKRPRDCLCPLSPWGALHGGAQGAAEPERDGWWDKQSILCLPGATDDTAHRTQTKSCHKTVPGRLDSVLVRVRVV